MENNIKVFRVHRALSWLYACLSVLFIITLGVGINSSDNHIPPELYYILSFLICFSILHFVISKGAKNGKLWARNSSFIVALLMLFGFPVGTIIGVYLLFNSGNWKALPTNT
jgi:uncharacterized membrane protein